MKSNSISLEDELKTLDKKCKLLLTGEWISLVLSGVGTVVTALTNQAVFAATPLTCSLFLNILSRSHQDKRIYDQSSQNLIEIQRQYASKLQGLRSEFLGMDFPEEGAEGISRSESFEEIASKVKQLESFLEIQGGDYYSQGGAINQEVSILRNHQLEMAETIETLTSQIEAVPGHPDQNDILDHLERLSAAVYDLEQKTAALADSEAEGTTIQGIMSNGSNISDQIEPIQSQMMALEERMNLIATADPAYDPETLQSSMEALTQPLQAQIAALEEQIQSQHVPVHDGSESSAPDQEQIESLNSNMAELQGKLEDSIAQISSDIGDFQHSLQTTHEQIDQIHQRMNALQELSHETAAANSSEALQHQIDALNAPLKEQLSSIQGQLGELHQLQTQMDQVRSLAQQSSEALNADAIHAQVSAATTPLMEKISSLEEKVQTQTATQDFTGQLHKVIEPLQADMVSLEQRINQLSAEGDRTPMLNKIAALQGHLQDVENRLNTVPTHSTDHSAELHLLTEKIVDMQSRLDSVSEKVSQNLAQMPQMIEENVEEKAELLSELQNLSFEEEITESKKETRSELDDLLNSLKF